MASTIPYVAIMKEDGVSSLEGIKLRGAFAKALWLERQAGHTTPEAWEQFLKAVEIEQAAA